MTARPKLLVTRRAGAVVEPRQERASSAALKSSRSLKAEKDKPPPPLPGPEFWFRAPYLGGGDELLGKVDPSSGRLSPSQQGVVDALRKSVRREKDQGGGKKGHGGVKNTFTEWARFWYKDLGASRAGEEAPVVIDGPGLKEPAHLAAFLAYWLTWYIFPGPPKDGVDTALFELAAILASGESVPLAPLFLGTLFKRLDMLHDAARRSCGRYDLPIYVATNFLHMFLFERFPKVAPEPNDFGGDDGGGEGEPCRSVCRSAQWSGSGVRDVRGGIADVIDIEGEFVARPYVNTPKGVFSLNVYSEEDVVTFANKDDASTAELFRMSCMIRGELPYFVNGKYGSVTYDPMRVARQFGYDQGVPKSLLPSGAVGDVWKRFLKSAFPAELRSMHTITLPGAKRMGGLEDVLSQDGELCLPKVKDPALASFGVRSPHVKEEVLGRVEEYLKNTYGILAKDVRSSVSWSDRDGGGQAEGVRLKSKHTSKRLAKDAEGVVKSGKRKKTSKGNEESSKAVHPKAVEEVVRIPRVEAETGGGSGVPSNSVEAIGGEESSKAMQTDDVEETVKTPRAEPSATAAGGCLAVPLDSLETIGTFEQNAAVHGVVNDIWEDEGVSSGGVSHPWKGKSLRHMRPSDGVLNEEEEEEETEGEEEEVGSEEDDRGDEEGEEEEGEEEAGLVEGRGGGGGKPTVWRRAVVASQACKRMRMGKECAVVGVGGKRWPSTFVRLGNMSTFSRRLALVSLVSFVELLEDVSLLEATPEDFVSVYRGLVALGSYQLEVDWLRKRIDQMAVLLELPAWRDRLEKVNKELEEVEATAARLRKRKEKLEGEVAGRENGCSGDFDMSSHAGQGLRR
ncbi:hypothetical protein RHGRI_035090 [Rhododendron griersonianum]|uniref:Aminotransferase-like plant mobile domain-containing protein n=1 Tax=Rhododendron griersonianum TaxID=479676 RepID=A0AAV6I374_9ERIC|nr:hypothetical protein RHGRI_035090 [Rhododendron griersonianum]